MNAPATITVNRLALEALVQELIDLIDTADRVTAMDVEVAAKDDEG